MYLDIELSTTSLDNLIWSASRISQQKYGIITGKNAQRKSGIIGHLIMNVGIAINIMKSIIGSGKEKSIKIGIIDELIMKNGIQTENGVIKKKGMVSTLSSTSRRPSSWWLYQQFGD